MMKKNIYAPMLVTALLLTSISSANALYYSCEPGENISTTYAKVNGNRIKECAMFRRTGGPSSLQEMQFENDYNFNSSDKYRSGTNSYNCHGLAYDKRYSWINFPNHIFKKFRDNGLATAFYNSVKGDRGIILSEYRRKDFEREIDNKFLWDYNGKKYYISHSWIYSENFHGLNTKVKSKYGGYGEYHHTLGDVLNVYWSDGKNTDKLIYTLKYGNGNFTYMSKINANNNDNNSLQNISNIVNKIPEVNNDKKINLFSEYNNIDFSSYTTKELINSIERKDLTSFYIASSPMLYKYYGTRNPKIKELYKRLDNGENIKENILEVAKSIDNGENIKENIPKLAKSIDNKEKIETLKQLYDFMK